MKRFESFFKGKGLSRNFLSLVLAATAVTGCTNEMEPPEDVRQPMRVSVMNDLLISRAIITDVVLPKGSEIGVTVTEDKTSRAAGDSYDGQEYNNIKYTAGDGNKWDTTTKPLFSSTPGKTIAYFPYKTDGNYLAIPVETASQTDYMYSGWVTGKNNSNPDVEFTMKHALTAFRVVLKKSADYNAFAKATAITVSSDKFVSSATLNAVDGSLSAWDGTGQITVPVNVVDGVTVGHTLSTTPQYTDIMVVPAEEAGTTVSFTVSIEDADGNSKNYTLSKEFKDAMNQGTCYQFTLTLTPKDLELDGTTVVLWGGPVEVGDDPMEPVI